MMDSSGCGTCWEVDDAMSLFFIMVLAGVGMLIFG